jgi:phenylpropionate dioxygenase-like ring-hydroxylating dioxygenase large terminal subunit
VAFLMNAWYVAAFSDEIKVGKVLARTLVGLPVVLYRDDARKIVALDDRCPHRFAPLSRGRVVDGAIECPYHGLRFGSSGACVMNPHGNGRVPEGATVRCYPTRERYGAIWFWPGEASRAESTPLPDFQFVDPRRNFTSTGYLLTRANYQLSSDNVLDLSHLQFLHPNTLGSEHIAAAQVECLVDGDSVSVTRRIAEEALAPFVARAFKVADAALVNRQLDVRWQPPALHTVSMRICETTLSNEFARVSHSAHWLTPETERSTHYFYVFGVPHQAGLEGAAELRDGVEALMTPFRDEDLPMLEAQQQVIGDRDFWSLRPVMLPIDAGAVRARRILERLIAAEAQTQIADAARIEPASRKERVAGALGEDAGRLVT